MNPWIYSKKREHRGYFLAGLLFLMISIAVLILTPLCPCYDSFYQFCGWLILALSLILIIESLYCLKILNNWGEAKPWQKNLFDYSYKIY